MKPAMSQPLQDLARADLLIENALVGGDWTAADSGATLAISNPADGSVIAHVPAMGAAETKRAIDAAEIAQKSWAQVPAKTRGQALRRLFDLMMTHQDDLATILTSEQGKPFAEAKGEIAYAASFIEWFAEEGRRAYGSIIPSNAADKRILVIKQPVGVCAAITPWNFPAAMVTRKLGPALAAGCAVVLKPSELTPLTALSLCKLAEEAGIPAGVLSCITGDPVAIGGELTSNPVVRKLSFTGSTEIGRLLMQQCAPTIKKLSLELGGNAPFIVFDDADLDAAVAGGIAAKFRNAGQTCVCTNRFLVQAGIHDAFVEKLAAASAVLSVGDGFAADSQIGPMIEDAAIDKVQAHIADAVAQGGQIVTGGHRHALGGLYFEPTVIAGASDSMLLAREETFGPVAAIFRFESEAEAIALANDTEFGLAAYLYSKDLGRCIRVSEALEYGMVGINEGIVSTEVAPFGGMKQSGLGREGSSYGLDDYMELKYLLVAGF
jgi:succinate-semialdehyde dehydrogenase / glutarate-semialdehyde dehydrogenase